MSRLISDRPVGWEFYLFAGAMLLELEPLESRYADYKLEYAPRSGITIYRSDLPEFINIQLSDLQVFAESFVRLFGNDEARNEALGPPGVAGDPARILHLARRYVSVYDDMLTWAERIRGISVASEYRKLIEILAKYVSQPIEEVRRFVEAYAESVERLTEMAASGEPILIEHRVTFSISDDLSREFSSEMDRLKRDLGR